MVTSLHELLGEIAVSDAAVDLWLISIGAEVVGLSEEAVRVFLRTDSSAAKVEKLKHLLPLSGVSADDDLLVTLNRVKPLKERRDSALHAYYVASSDGSYIRHRPRSEPVSVQHGELETLRDDLRLLLRDLEVQHLRLSQGRAVGGDIGELLRDCFEILAAYRLESSGRLELLRSEWNKAQVTLDLYGHGRFELSDSDSQRPNAGNEVPRAVAQITPSTGKVDLTMADGREVSGGDTGWRNVLDQVRQVTPSAKSRFWRRINDAEQYVSDEEHWWPPAGLDDRLTAESAKDLMARIQRERQTFLPDERQSVDPPLS